MIRIPIHHAGLAIAAWANFPQLNAHFKGCRSSKYKEVVWYIGR